MPCRSPIIRSWSGFTLIELMVVLTLIAILSSMILPEMRGGFEDAILRSTARRWVEVFGLANSRAIASQEQVRVNFDRAKMRFQMEHLGGPKGARRHFEPLNDSSAFSGAFDPRVSVTLQTGGTNNSIEGMPVTSMRTSIERSGRRTPSTSDTTVRFFPDGTCDEAVLSLRDLSGHRMTIRLNPVTARLTVLDQP